jgi:hypothetical protein
MNASMISPYSYLRLRRIRNIEKIRNIILFTVSEGNDFWSEFMIITIAVKPDFKDTIFKRKKIYLGTFLGCKLYFEYFHVFFNIICRHVKTNVQRDRYQSVLNDVPYCFSTL